MSWFKIIYEQISKWSCAISFILWTSSGMTGTELPTLMPGRKNSLSCLTGRQSIPWYSTIVKSSSLQFLKNHCRKKMVLVRMYNSTYDAQDVFHEQLAYLFRSTKVTTYVASLLSDITSVRLWEMDQENTAQWNEIIYDGVS